MKNTKQATVMDIHVGKKIKIKRKLSNMTQGQLAKKVGVSAQQVQKYESGDNRVAASTLYDIAAIFETNIDYFFYGLDYLSDVDLNKHDLTFIKSFNAIKCKVTQKRLIHLINSINNS